MSELLYEIKFFIEEYIWSKRVLRLTVHKLLQKINRRLGGNLLPIDSEEIIEPYMTPLHGGCFVDVGANFGMWTNYVAKKGFEVYAFEPSPRPYKYLVKRALPNVHVYNIALGDKNGEAILNLHRMSVYDSVICKAKGFFLGKTIRVSMKTLDSFQFENVGLIKIDTEGYEFPVLLGAKETIERCKPRVIVEVHSPYEQQILTIEKLMRGMNYAIIRKYKPGTHQPMLICEPKEQ